MPIPVCLGVGGGIDRLIALPDEEGTVPKGKDAREDVDKSNMSTICVQAFPEKSPILPNNTLKLTRLIEKNKVRGKSLKTSVTLLAEH